MKQLFKTLSLVLVLFSTAFSFAQQPDTFDYLEAWRQVELKQKDGKPNEALKIVDGIYSRAKQEDQFGHYLKAVICQVGLSTFTEDGLIQKHIDKIDYEIKTSSEPQTQILYTYKAQIL